MLRVTIHTDGACKGNPGDAGVGVVIKDDTGNILKEIAEYIGKTTNNEAEYIALLVGLREAAILGATDIMVKTDSELMARQLNGQYQVKSPKLINLYQEAVQVLRAFQKAKVVHVMREENSRADKLANEGVKKKTKTKTAAPAKEAKSAVASKAIETKHKRESAIAEAPKAVVQEQEAPILTRVFQGSAKISITMSESTNDSTSKPNDTKKHVESINLSLFDLEEIIENGLIPPEQTTELENK